MRSGWRRREVAVYSVPRAACPVRGRAVAPAEQGPFRVRGRSGVWALAGHYADLGRAATLVAGVVVSTGVAMDVIPGMCFGIMREGHRSVLYEVPEPFQALRQATGVVLVGRRVRHPQGRI